MRANTSGFEIKAANYQPASPEERVKGLSILLPLEGRQGFVFLLAYTEKEKGGVEQLYGVLNDHMRHFKESFTQDANPQHRFEQFLGTLNDTLAKHVREGAWNVPITELNAVVGMAADGEMYLSGTGELTALFLHKKTTNRFQVFNLFRGIQTEQALPTWEKVFAVVLDGDLHAGDAFCLTNKDIQSAIESDDLNQVLSTLPPVGSVEQLRQFFGPKDHVQLIVLKMQDRNVVAQPIAPTNKPATVSIEEFADTQDTTSQYLDDQNPSVRVFLRRTISYLKERSKRSESRILKDLQSDASTMVTVRRVAQNLLRGTMALSKKWKRQIKKAKNNVQQHGYLQPNQLKKIWSQAKNKLPFTQPSPKRPTVLLGGGIVVAILVLIIGIGIISRSQTQSAAERAYKEQIVTIEEMIERAAGAIIYRDENQARSLYINAQTLTEDLPEETEGQIARKGELEQQIDTALNELRNLVTIPNPPLLAEITTAGSGARGSSLLQRSGDVYVVTQDGNLYQYDNNNGRLSKELTLENPLVDTISATGDTSTYVLTENGEVYYLNSNSQTAQLVEIPANETWADIQQYGTRLYLLQPETEAQGGQILRYDISATDTANQTEWITSRSLPLTDAQSLAIDGTIFVLMRNGNIARFESGSETGWDAGVVDPRITDAQEIWTDSESDYVYVMEPKTQRVIVFEKATGQFIVQYRSDAFKHLQDMIVDETNQTIYLLTESQLYSIAASHLE